VIHLAGATGARQGNTGWAEVHRSVEVNLCGTLNLLEAVAESGASTRVFLRAGGLAEYGAGPTPYVETQREQPLSAYAASQVAATHALQVLQPRLPFAAITLRPALLYGPAQSPSFFIPGLIVSCVHRTPFRMTAGAQRRDLLYVEDAVDACLRAAVRADLRGAVLNVGSGEAHAIRDVAAHIVALTGATQAPAIGATPTRPDDIEVLLGDSRAAWDRLGWRATTSLEEGLRRTIAWFREHPEPMEA
jgi:nucleoside-diphosphate-sugar epimerase